MLVVFRQDMRNFGFRFGSPLALDNFSPILHSPPPKNETFIPIEVYTYCMLWPHA